VSCIWPPTRVAPSTLAPESLGSWGANAEQHRPLAQQLMAMAASLKKSSHCHVPCRRGRKSGKKCRLPRRGVTCSQTYRTGGPRGVPGRVWGCMHSHVASVAEDLKRNIKIRMCDLEDESRLHHSPDQLCLLKPSSD